MRATAIGTTAVLVGILGISCAAFAGQEHQAEKQEHAKPEQSSHQQQAAPQHERAPQQPRQGQQTQQRAQQPARQTQSQPQQHAQSQPRQAHAQPQQHAQQSQNRQTGHAQVQRASGKQMQPQERQRAWQDHRAGNWQSDHRTWQQRGGYNGYRIPEARYGGYFGAGHNFRIGGLPFLVVGGFPRFQYSGYWFSMVDPWPGDWANNWYDTDDCYVVYQDNGYYLFDRGHPGVGIAISVSL